MWRTLSSASRRPLDLVQALELVHLQHAVGRAQEHVHVLLRAKESDLGFVVKQANQVVDGSAPDSDPSVPAASGGGRRSRAEDAWRVGAPGYLGRSYSSRPSLGAFVSAAFVPSSVALVAGTICCAMRRR